MNLKSPISKRLKDTRLEARMSQKQLGIAAGVDEFVASAKFNQYETGKHVPDFSMVQQIAKVLKLPAAYFYSTEDELAKLITKKKRELSVWVTQLAEL